MLGLLILCLALYLPGQMTIPPVDRDEARFAQATKQMVESRDYIDIRFQDQPRYNKPIGIYWLQTASVKLTGAVHEIWPYRVPSWLGATAAVLLTASFATRLFGSGAGTLAGAILATSLLMSIEARLAKADAVLLACTVLAQGILARLYLERALGRLTALLFWAALGAGILVKGPIILLVAISTILVLTACERSIRWLAPVRPISGMVLLLVITVPWLTAITLQSDGAFWRDSVGKDLVAKVMAGQESHGAPPGYYLFTVFLTFWPWSPLLLAAAWFSWRHRRSANVRLCLAWIIPTWLVFECVPTKLPHYTLPVFPALAALVSATVLTNEFPRWMCKIAFWHSVLLVGSVMLGILGAVRMLDAALFPFAATATVLVCGLAIGAWRSRRQKPAVAAALGAVALVFFYGVSFGWLFPRLDTLWLSRSATALINQHRHDSTAPVVVAGYHEPSLVFLAGSTTVLEPEGDAGLRDAERRLQEGPGTLLLIDSSLRTRLTLPVAELGRVRGINYSKGRRMELVLVRLASRSLPQERSTASPVAGRVENRQHFPRHRRVQATTAPI